MKFSGSDQRYTVTDLQTQCLYIEGSRAGMLNMTRESNSRSQNFVFTRTNFFALVFFMFLLVFAFDSTPEKMRHTFLLNFTL